MGRGQGGTSGQALEWRHSPLDSACLQGCLGRQQLLPSAEDALKRGCPSPQRSGSACIAHSDPGVWGSHPAFFNLILPHSALPLGGRGWGVLSSF